MKRPEEYEDIHEFYEDQKRKQYNEVMNTKMHAKQIAEEMKADGQMYRYIANTFIEVAHNIVGHQFDDGHAPKDVLDALKFIKHNFEQRIKSYEEDIELDKEESLDYLNKFVREGRTIELELEDDWCLVTMRDSAGDSIVTVEGDCFAHCLKELEECEQL